MTVNESNTIIREKKAKLEVVSKLLDTLKEFTQENSCEFTEIGREKEQARDWKTDELLWDDDAHTIPHYRPKYGYVPLAPEKLTEQQVANLAAADEIAELLQALV